MFTGMKEDYIYIVYVPCILYILFGKKKDKNNEMEKNCNTKIMQALFSSKRTALYPQWHHASSPRTLRSANVPLSLSGPFFLHRQKYTFYIYSPQQRVDVSLVLLNILLVKNTLTSQCNLLVLFHVTMVRTTRIISL